jgi:hypothetical protein
MDATGDATEPQGALDGEGAGQEQKRFLGRPDEEPASKRVKAEHGVALARTEDEQPETVKPLPKGTAPVKKE